MWALWHGLIQAILNYCQLDGKGVMHQPMCRVVRSPNRLPHPLYEPTKSAKRSAMVTIGTLKGRGGLLNSCQPRHRPCTLYNACTKTSRQPYAYAYMIRMVDGSPGPLRHTRHMPNMHVTTATSQLCVRPIGMVGRQTGLPKWGSLGRLRCVNSCALDRCSISTVSSFIRVDPTSNRDIGQYSTAGSIRS